MTLLRGQQNLRALDPAHPSFAAAGQLLQLRAFFITKFNDVSYVHPGLHR